MAFACDECARSWPDKDNQLDDPGRNEGICPECYDGDDEDEDERTRQLRQQYQRSLTPPNTDDDSE